jgi:hypothetical protein
MMRNVMTRVLPVPAPARISTGPFKVSTAWRCWGFSEFKFNTRAEFNFRSAQCNVVEDFFVSFSGNRVRKAWTKMASALAENISSGEKPRQRARTIAVPIKTAVITKFGHALSAH